MNIKSAQGFLLSLLAVIFTVGLTFASVELPRLINLALFQEFDFPGFDSSWNDLNVEKTELFVRHFHIRLIGYISLALVIILIVVGFITNKSGLSSAGAIAFFLPVFGGFALSMFFLAGLGMLRVIWMPILDVSYDLLRLGDLVYVPYRILVYIPSLAGFDIRPALPYVLMGSGILLFVQGTLAWFYAKLQKKGTADFWVYRISRHPQYVGWIIWSYGLIFYQGSLVGPKVTWDIQSSLPWLLSTIVIIGVAMMEELKMSRERGEEYESYRRQTPFMLPLGRFVSSIISAPMRLILRKQFPERKREIAAVLALYTVILVMFSAPLWVFESRPWTALWIVPYNNEEQRIDELVTVLKEAEGRREKDRAAMSLAAIGDPAVEALIELLKNEDSVVREFSAGALGRIQSEKAVESLIDALLDQDRRVRSAAATALGKIQSEKALQPLMSSLNDENSSVRYNAAEAVGRIGSEQAVDALVAGLNDERNYVRVAIATALGRIGSERTVDPLIRALKDEDNQVRQASVLALLKTKSEKAVEPLIEALTDEDWEVRLYAVEALERIGTLEALKAIDEYKD